MPDLFITILKVCLIAVIVIVICVLAVCVAVAVYLFKMALTRKGVKSGPEKLTGMQEKQRAMREEAGRWLEEQEDVKEVSITSFDGLKLTAQFIPAADPRRTVICAHGFRASGVKDFGPMLKFYRENGSNVLLIRQRAHSLSEGKYLCYGVKERFDVQKWAEYVNEALVPERLPIFLHGVSMGCATVVMATDIELPDNILGIVADCGFTSAWDEFEYIMKKNFHLPTFPILNIADLICRFTAGFAMKDCNTLKIMEHEKYPILFIHGGKDDFVPTRMGIANHEKCVSKKRLELFDDAAHALSWTADLERYERVVTGFLEDCEG